MLCCLVWTVTWASLGLQQYSAWSHGWMDPSFYSSPAPSPAGGTLGLLQVSCPSLEVGGSPGLTMHSHPAFQAVAASHPPALPAQHCSPAVGPRAPLTDIDLPKAEHHSPLSPPHGRNPQHCRWATVSYALHFTRKALLSPVPSPLWRKLKLHVGFLFVCCFYQSPSFLPTPNLLAGTKSLSPWSVILISRFSGTDPSVTSQSSLLLLSLPCGATLLCMRACCV